MTFTTNYDISNAYNFEFGYHASSRPSFIGYVDELMVFHDVISRQQAEALYRMGR